jgi:quercetin dioxygenase-like cupin family protein
VFSSKMRLNVFFLAILVVIAFVVLAVTAVLANSAKLTPPDGLSATPIASGDLIEPVHAVFGHDGTDESEEEGEETDMPHSGTEVDVSKLTLTKYEVEPGGTFGWHQHGGPVWVVVVSGAITIYTETCEAQVYSTGSAFLDYGNHTHYGINEDTQPLELYAVFMLPEEGEPRIDIEQPETCVL